MKKFESNKKNKFGTFQGVFTPTILTIIGAIMYLRLGWVVGQVGLIRAIFILILAHIVTFITAMSVSSISTNTKVGAGGFYSMLSRSLGLEFGGAVGIPLYISQALSTSLYVFAFAEAFTTFINPYLLTYEISFTQNNIRLYCLLFLFILSYLGAGIAIKFQYLIMAIVGLSIFSFMFGVFSQPSLNVASIVNFGLKEENFWNVFAIFFPAVTGIGAGAAMSGDLKDPQKSLPKGILLAVLVGFFVYIIVTITYAIAASNNELVNNNLIMADVALFGTIVFLGILGATFSSALGSILGAPRILMALANDNLIPFKKLWSRKNKRGEPFISSLFTLIIIFISFYLGNLNSIATLLTMFFLVTYAAINVAIFIEQAVGSSTFRPSFKIPLWLSLVGAIWSSVVMFLINPLFSLIAIFSIIVIYFLQMRRNLINKWGDTRSGFFNTIAEYSVKMASRLPQGRKNWKPNFLIPVENPNEFASQINFVKDIALPRGTLRVFSIFIREYSLEKILKKQFEKLFKNKIQQENEEISKSIKLLKDNLNELITPLKKEGIFVASTVVEGDNLVNGFYIVTQVMKDMYFPPNILLLTMGENQHKDKQLDHMINIADRSKLGVILLAMHKKNNFNQKKNINLWIRKGSPNLNLTVLVAMLLNNNWHGVINLVCIINRDDLKKSYEEMIQKSEKDGLKNLYLSFEEFIEEEKNKEEKHLNKIINVSRMRHVKIEIIEDVFSEIINNPPPSDLNIFGAPENFSVSKIRYIVDNINTSCLFVQGSGNESISI